MAHGRHAGALATRVKRRTKAPRTSGGPKTARKRSARTLADELRLAIDTIPVLAWQSRNDGFVEYMNKRWLEFTGLALADAVGWKWQNAIHPDDLPGLIDTWRVVLTAEEPGEAEARLRRFDGTYRYFLFRAAPLRDARGNVLRWYGTNTDIEDRKHAEDALRRSEGYLAEAQRLSRTGSFSWNAESGILHWSDETFRIYEYDTLTSPTLEMIRQRVHPDEVGIFDGMIDRMWSGEQTIRAGHRVLLPDGTIKDVDVVARAARKPSGPLEYVGAVMDVTAEKRAKDALERAQAELAHVTRLTTMGELTASIAHEVNQPLGAIVTNGETSLRWLDRAEPALDRARASIAAMIADARRANEVIQRLRALSKKADLQKVRLDVNTLIADVISLIERELSRNNVSLRLDLTPKLPAVLADRVHLQQVVINLVINGVQAMVSVNDRPRRLSILTRPDGDHVRITVQDTGPGIAPENIERLFGAFFTTKPDGMGMGLSICRSAVEAHGGRIWALGHEGPGAAFHFTLPAGGES